VPDVSAPAELTLEQATETIRSRPCLGLSVLAAVIVYQLQQRLYKPLLQALGSHNGPVVWWSLAVLADRAPGFAALCPAVQRERL